MNWNKLLPTLLIAAVMLLSGCSTESFKGTLKSTKSFYNEYINPPAEVDYSLTGSLEDAEHLMVRQLYTINGQLTSLERTLQSMDRGPSPELIELLMRNFPWLSGIALIDHEGTLLGQEPSISLKSLDFSVLLAERKKDRRDVRDLRCAVQDTPFGPEVLLGIPVFRDADLAGIFIVHFDMRNLVREAPEPGNFVVTSPEAVLWPGKFVLDSTPLAGRNWEEIAASDVTGTFSNDNGEFYWMVRFLGAEPLVFAVPRSGTFPEDASALDALGIGS